jgi:hypothetical protein
MGWVYGHTGGSLLVAMLMHMSLASAIRIFMPLPLSRAVLIDYDDRCPDEPPTMSTVSCKPVWDTHDD